MKLKVKRRPPRLTRLEKLTKGLANNPNRYKSRFTINEIKDKGRSLFLMKGMIKKDSFVLEYEGDLISHREAERREAAYAINKEGCYILFFKFQRQNWAIDATRHYTSYARYLNHSRQPNIKFHTPLIVDLNGGDVPRIAAYALRDINEGEEIVFDYGVRDKDISWLKNSKGSHMSELAPEDSSSSESTSEDENESSSDDNEITVQKPKIMFNPSHNQPTGPSLSVGTSKFPPHTSTARSSMQFFSYHANGFGMRFFPKISSSRERPSYRVQLENLDEPKKILRRIMEPCSPTSVISLSGSESKVKSMLPNHESERSFSVDLDDRLPRNSEPSSATKVFEWQCVDEIKILNVKSLVGLPASSSSSISLSETSKSNFSLPKIAEVFSEYMLPQMFTPEVENASFMTKDEPSIGDFHRPTFQEIKITPPLSHSITTGSDLASNSLFITSDVIPNENRNINSHSNSLVNDDNDDDIIILDSPEISKAGSQTGSKVDDDFEDVEIISSASDSDLEETVLDRRKKNVFHSIPKSLSAVREDHSMMNLTHHIPSTSKIIERIIEKHDSETVRKYPGPSLSSSTWEPSPHIIMEEDSSNTCAKQFDQSLASAISPAATTTSSQSHHSIQKSLSALLAVREDHSKMNLIHHIPSTSEIIIEDDDSETVRKYPGPSLSSSIREPSPDLIMEEDSSNTCVNQFGKSLALSISPATTTTSSQSHQGSSLLRHSSSSAPVAVIKPFNAFDGLNITDVENIKLREILSPHLFSSNATSQEIQAAIIKNWSFFKTLTERGVTIDGIRGSVRRFVTAAEEKKRLNMNKKKTKNDNQTMS